MEKILYLIDTLQTGGAEKSLLEITSRFQKFKPVFLTIYQGDHALEAAYQKVGLEVHHLNFPKATNYKNILPKLRAYVLGLQPVLIHASLFHAEMLSRKLNLSIPIINSLVNNSYHPRRYQALTWKGKLALLRVYLQDRITKNKVDLFIANSAYMAEVHQKSLSIHADKIKVIHRGRDPLVFEYPDLEKAASLRAQLPNPETKLFLHIGRLIDRKGQEDLIHAFSKLITKIAIPRTASPPTFNPNLPKVCVPTDLQSNTGVPPRSVSPQTFNQITVSPQTFNQISVSKVGVPTDLKINLGVPTDLKINLGVPTDPKPIPQLWLVGKGEQQTHLQNLVENLNLQEQVIFLGDRKDIPELLAAADYFVFPSHYEGLPGALIEAMMAKVPIIASDIPENKECLTSDMALFHKVRNSHDLATQLQAALTTQDWPIKTQLAYTHACEHFDIHHITQTYEETYIELIRNLRD